MARDYWFAFGTGNPATYSGLAPTFISFINNAGTTYAPPTITERASTGLYQISYGATQTIAFVMDGATSGLATSDRYISGVFDPYDQFGVTLNAAFALGTTSVALGTTSVAIGTTSVALLNINNLAIGSTASSYGSTSVDPVDLYGFLKRARELSEGNQIYTKATGILDMYVRSGVTLLIEKTITDTSTTTTKS